jgi:hypothetical protein
MQGGERGVDDIRCIAILGARLQCPVRLSLVSRPATRIYGAAEPLKVTRSTKWFTLGKKRQFCLVHGEFLPEMAVS